MRLQKILAAAGLGSRRQCEELILAGRVEVDRRVVRELGTKADLSHEEVRVDGVALPRPRLVYFAVNKPPGVVSTSRDPAGRTRVIDLVPYRGRLFTVGRLDMSSEGLILVTNDGQLADHLTHPRYGVRKTYHVEVAGALTKGQLARLRRGVHLAEGFARVVSAEVLRTYRQSTLLEIVLAEGRNREIRRVLARVGHKVERLRRVAIGPLRLGELQPAEARPLTSAEVRRLKRCIGAPARTTQGGDKHSSSSGTAAGRRPRRSTVGRAGSTRSRSTKNRRRAARRPRAGTKQTTSSGT